MSKHYYNEEDLKKFGKIGEFQKPLADKFLPGMAKYLPKVRLQQRKNH